MNITVFGSCRQDSLYKNFNVTNIKNNLTYPHYSKEIVQAIEFCKNISSIPPELTQYLFRSGILEKRLKYSCDFKNTFDTTDLFVVEIASRIAYDYKGFYAHHILSEEKYGFNDCANIIQRDLTDEEIYFLKFVNNAQMNAAKKIAKMQGFNEENRNQDFFTVISNARRNGIVPTNEVWGYQVNDD
jgi:hypothetical protein